MEKDTDVSIGLARPCMGVGAWLVHGWCMGVVWVDWFGYILDLVYLRGWLDGFMDVVIFLS